MAPSAALPQWQCTARADAAPMCHSSERPGVLQLAWTTASNWAPACPPGCAPSCTPTLSSSALGTSWATRSSTAAPSWPAAAGGITPLAVAPAGGWATPAGAAACSRDVDTWLRVSTSVESAADWAGHCSWEAWCSAAWIFTGPRSAYKCNRAPQLKYSGISILLLAW